MVSLLENGFGEKITDELIKHYVSDLQSGKVNNYANDNASGEEGNGAGVTAAILFGSDEDRQNSHHLANRHYDMQMAEDMLGASILSSQIVGAGSTANEAADVNEDTVTESDFCLYYDERMELLLLAGDDTTAKYIASLAIKRDNDYAEEIQNFITCKYLASGDFDEDGDDENMIMLVSNVERFLSIISRGECGTGLITHFILFQHINDADDADNNADNNADEILLIEVSPFGDEIINGSLNPIFITMDGGIVLDREAEKRDPLMTLNKISPTDMFSKLCELSPSFKMEISKCIAQDDLGLDKFIKDYLIGRLKSSDHTNWTAGLLFSEKFSDIVVKTNDGVSFNAHKLILVNFSGYFNTLFYGTKSAHVGRVVTFDEESSIGAKVFKDILTFIYTGRVDFSAVESVVNLILAAEYLQIDELIKFFRVHLYT